MNELETVVQTLHILERKVLLRLKDASDFLTILKQTGLQEVEVIRALHWLENKKIVVLEKSEESHTLLDKNGLLYLQKGFPEKRFLQAIAQKTKSIEEIKKEAQLDDVEASFSIGILRKKGYMTIDAEKNLVCTEEGKKAADKEWSEEKILKTFSVQKKEEKKIENSEELRIIEQLKQRREILKKITDKKIHVTLTPFGKKVAEMPLDTSFIEAITAAMLKEKTWKNQAFRRYDLHSTVPKMYGGRIHPLSSSMNRIRKTFLEMGFKEMEGPWVETAFWCMDSMWIPQDHPAREMQDTFYLPYKGTIPKELSKKIKEEHEHGGNCGSKGYGGVWNPEIAKQLLLRTHTTATTFRYFGEKQIKPPAKYFYIGRIFRNEAIDATHLPEFHHSEGFVMEEGLTLRDLMGYIREFYATLGIHKIKFKPTYNPYTEPSMEAIGYNEQLGKWIELINSGMFRPESLEPYGITVPVIAWGLGVERLAMMLHQEKNIRNMFGATGDLDWLRTYKIRW